MNLCRCPDKTLTHQGRGGSADHVVRPLPQVEVAVAPVAEGAVVLAGLLCKLAGIGRAASRGPEVAQYGIGPREPRRIARPAVGHDDEGAGKACTDATYQVVQTITADIATGDQVRARPVGDGLVGGVSGEGDELHAHRMDIDVVGDCLQDGHVVGLTALTDAGALAAEVGGIELNRAREGRFAVARGHRTHQLPVNQPSEAVQRTQVAHQRQRQRPCLGWADQVFRQGPRAKGQLGSLLQDAGRQRCLVATSSALVPLATAMGVNVVIRPGVSRTVKDHRTALRTQRRQALCFAPVEVRVQGHGHTGLRLDSVHRNRVLPSTDRVQLGPLLAQGMSRTKLRAQSEILKCSSFRLNSRADRPGQYLIPDRLLSIGKPQQTTTSLVRLRTSNSH